MKKSSRIPYCVTNVAFFIFLNLTLHAAPPRLLPFQGRLTDHNGIAIADGAKVVQFKIYDAPTGGNSVWAGEVQKLSVNGGLISTLLGSKASLDSLDFNQSIYLEVTVDSNGDDQISLADPPLLPRQSVLPSVFAVQSQQARELKAGDGQSYDWTALFGNQSPASGKIDGSRIGLETITDGHLSPHTISSDSIATGAIDSASIANNSIAIEDLAAAVKNALIPPGTILPYGGTSPPAGFLLCDGTSYSRADYGALHNAIGENFGSSDSTKFNVPDLRGRFLRGVDGTAGNDPNKSDQERPPMNAGGNVGNRVGSIQTDQLGSHSHTLPGTNWLQFNVGGHGVMNDGPSVPKNVVSNPSTSAAGGNETRPKNANVNYIIKY